MIEQKNELYHYGVKGMKWGVRKAMRKEYRELYDKEYERRLKKYGTTDDDDKDVEKYQLKLKADDEAYDYTVKKMIKKYGKETYDSFVKGENRRGMLQASAIIAAMLAPGAALAVLNIVDKRRK